MWYNTNMNQSPVGARLYKVGDLIITKNGSHGVIIGFNGVRKSTNDYPGLPCYVYTVRSLKNKNVFDIKEPSIRPALDT